MKLCLRHRGNRPVFCSYHCRLTYTQMCGGHFTPEVRWTVFLSVFDPGGQWPACALVSVLPPVPEVCPLNPGTAQRWAEQPQAPTLAFRPPPAPLLRPLSTNAAQLVSPDASRASGTPDRVPAETCGCASACASIRSRWWSSSQDL